MKAPFGRSGGVSDAIAQPAPPLSAGTATDSFESLYRSAFPRVYAYVASLVRDRAVAVTSSATARSRTREAT